MSHPVQRTANDYRLLVAEADGEAVARQGGGALLARSEAAKVMFETRLRPAVYFPRESVAVPLTRSPSFQTFCPFKGAATYWDVEIGGAVFPRAAWSYEHALPEALNVEGMLSFSPDVATEILVDGAGVTPAVDGHISGPTVDWLLREAPYFETPEALTKATALRLREDGVALSRMSILIWSLHPSVAGTNYIWRRGEDVLEVRKPSYAILESEQYTNSPLRYVADGLGGVRQRLDVETFAFDFEIMHELRGQGATDYVAMPLLYSDGAINVLTMASDHPKGFTTANLGLVFECSLVLGRLFEVFTLRENATTLLDTYLGRRTGARVLGGSIRRGDGDEIDAAILYCDLRGSTALEERLDRQAYLALLNQFFELATEVVNAHGGEVLKFIGDAVLAIFPAGDDRLGACREALAAAREIVASVCEARVGESEERLDCAIGVAFGDVMYGNVGAAQRLDFTVIGAAANIAARLSDLGKRHDCRIVATREIASCDLDQGRSLGEVALRGVSAPIEAWGVSEA